MDRSQRVLTGLHALFADVGTQPKVLMLARVPPALIAADPANGCTNVQHPSLAAISYVKAGRRKWFWPVHDIGASAAT
jgi:hypothetical protein